MAESSEPIEPQYTTDEKTDFAFIRVSCSVPKLTVSRKFKTKKLIPKVTKEPGNAEVDIKFEETCFKLTVVGNSTGEMKGKKYELEIRKLPKLIIPEGSYFSVKEERIVVWLKKKNSESWYPELEEGLDAYEEPPEEDASSNVKTNKLKEKESSDQVVNNDIQKVTNNTESTENG